MNVTLPQVEAGPVLTTILAVMGVAALVGAVLLLLLVRRLRRLDVPDGAGFWGTLRRVPFLLVVALDLLDLGLDVFAAPVVWTFLSRFRLQGLRQVATVEAFLPFTQPIPLLSACWLLARFTGVGDESSG